MQFSNDLPMRGCGPVRTDGHNLKNIRAAKGSNPLKAFEPSSIGNIKLRNRIIRSAVTMNGADENGRPKDTLLDHYTDLAAGGAGAIITGMRDTGMMMDNFLYREDFFSDYKKVPYIAHKYNTAVIQQLSHHGGQLSFEIERKSFINKLSESDSEDLTNLFVKGISASRRLGFDAVQLHAAHGYMLSDLLSSAKNERKDKWGGSLENRFSTIRIHGPSFYHRA